MKKIIFLSFFVGLLALATGLNFSGHQSVVNLGRTQLFTAPASKIYFINGTLTLPQLSQGSSAPSQAVVQVSKNGVTSLYYGVPGASGFSLPSVVLASPDSVAISVTSNASVDQGLNVIKGDVFFGNSN